MSFAEDAFSSCCSVYFHMNCVSLWLFQNYNNYSLCNFSTGWFGLRKDVCQFLLGVCPLLQEYANISYSIPHAEESQADNRSPLSVEGGVVTSEKKDVVASSRRLEHRVVVPAISLEVPD